MTDPIIGLEVRMRLYEGAKTLGTATGTITERLPDANRSFHDAFIVRLLEPIEIEDMRINEAYLSPTGRYPFQPGKDKLKTLLRPWGRVVTTFSWRSKSGEWMTIGERGTFAEVSKIRWYHRLLHG